ncbi:NADH-quinone oxidoreductase subunit C [Streptomyces solaniscabiei]|uniref:NADH-quinone oxidoreductase subunit C n=1 Tax=Streptomyces solaniscabiei TaxID=2683255 RepID=UPI001CE233A0|nr:NADH-quinone oxidoreductase subunit C [Streptomyces solaniscabiei]
MSAVGWLPADAGELFGAEATAEESYDLLTVDVPPAAWISALETARDRLGCTYFDWLSAVDEPGTGFRVAAHVAALAPVRRLLVRTTVPHESPVLPTAVAVYAGAAWHERETHEMFGVVFEDHPALDHLLLPEGFEGHPLRKDFVLAARVAKAWPGAKEPGESDHGGPRRRQMLPPGVPDPNEWGPLKGQLPPAPARPARGAARAAGDRPARAAGERPARRMRTAAQGSAGQTAPVTETPGTETPGAAAPAVETPATGTSAAGTPAPETSATRTPATESSSAPPASTPRRARSASQGSASQRPGPAAPEGPADAAGGEGQEATGPSTPTARRARSASEGSASQRTDSTAGRSDEAGPSGAAGETRPAPKPAAAPRSPDAPWHHARPAFDEPTEPTEPAEEPEGRGSTEHGETPGSAEAPERPDSPEDAEGPVTPESPEDPETRDATRPPVRPETPDDRPGGTQ